MGKVTITLQDVKDGDCRVTAKFTPAPKEGKALTNAQWSAMWMMNGLNEKLRKEPLFKEAHK